MNAPSSGWDHYDDITGLSVTKLLSSYEKEGLPMVWLVSYWYGYGWCNRDACIRLLVDLGTEDVHNPIPR